MSSKKHSVYVVQEGPNGKSYWNRAGIAFQNRDGSFTLKLGLFPDTRLQLREDNFAG